MHINKQVLDISQEQKNTDQVNSTQLHQTDQDNTVTRSYHSLHFTVDLFIYDAFCLTSSNNRISLIEKVS